MNHLVGRTLNVGAGTIAYFAKKPAGKLLVFVHGFNGDATATWADMSDLLREEKKTDGWDIVFYGYDSRSAQALISANLLRQFLDQFVAPHGRTKLSSQPLRETSNQTVKYSKIVIVAHSLGGAISRRAVLDAIQIKSAWVKLCKLILFAPAHHGASMLELAKELGALHSLLAFARLVAHYRIPVLQDLTPGSNFLQALEQQTKSALATHRGAPLIATKIIYGQRDNVVQATRPFCDDPPSDAWAGHSHISVCKAKRSFPDPFDVLKSYL